MPSLPKTLPIALALAWGATTVYAADARPSQCTTTSECMALAASTKASVSGAGPMPATSGVDRLQDRFYWVGRINKASTVMLLEEKIISPELAHRMALGVAHSIEQAGTKDGKRPSDVLQIERLITDEAGPEASRIHSGRSRQDIHATFNAAKLRTQVLDYLDAMNASRERMLTLADQHVDTLIPAYTNGVQAMPVSLGHYLHAYAASFERDGQRLRELYGRANKSAMGTAVLSNSGWPLNRTRMADLLGFDGIVENALDSSQVTPFDVPLEATGIVSSAAIRVGALIGDIHTQYHQTRPWLLLEEGSTYTSSAMPQKRNPGIIMRVRESASDVVGAAHAVTLRAHNVTTGMTDYKAAWQTAGVYPAAVRMQNQLDAVLAALTVNAARAEEELNDDWTTSMELADTLQRLDGIPFRVGHSVASAIVTYAREHNLRPADFPYDQAQRLFTEVTTKYKLDDTTLPLSEADFRASLSARSMVDNRVGEGGPQPAEVKRMLKEARAALVQDQEWSRKQRERIMASDKELDAAFEKLLTVPAT